MVSALGWSPPPATSLEPPPHAASSVAVTAMAPRRHEGLHRVGHWVTFPCGRLNGRPVTTARRWISVNARHSDSRHQTADGLGSATTVHISNSAITHGNEGQNMALGSAGRCVHGAKRNRAAQGQERAKGTAEPAQRAINHMTITSTTRMTSTNVTRERGMPVTARPRRCGAPFNSLMPLPSAPSSNTATP